GMTRATSVLNMMMMSYVAMGVVGLVYVLWGWSESFGPHSWLGGLLADPFALFGLEGVGWGAYIGVCFQMTFAVITAALISGAIADRVRLSSWVVFLPVWVTLCYFPLAHMVWGGGFLAQHLPAQDYAGGTVVHINAGVAGGVLALIIGRRVGFGTEAMKPHNLTLTMLGAGLLWFGWYGFNVGSIVLDTSAKDGGVGQFMTETGVTFLNTTVATMAAMLAWLLVERVLHGRATSLGAASGIVAGLVAITPACGAVDTLGAIAIGALAGAACAGAVGLKFRFGLDDSLDVVGVHLVGGVVGTVLIGFFSTSSAPGGIDGLFHGGGWSSLGHQAGAAAFTIVWTGVWTTAIGLAIKHTIGWRISAEAELDGIDLVEHGESAYDLEGRPSALRGGGLHVGVTRAKHERRLGETLVGDSSGP
ncbi:MAG: ammonium transporter, partial [Marmoricola sp.]